MTARAAPGAAAPAGEDGGRRIVIASHRRMSFLEAANQPRTVDYPFTVIELRLDNEGNGDLKSVRAVGVSRKTAKP